MVFNPFWYGHGSWDLKVTEFRDMAPCSLVVAESLGRVHYKRVASCMRMSCTMCGCPLNRTAPETELLKFRSFLLQEIRTHVCDIAVFLIIYQET